MKEAAERLKAQIVIHDKLLVSSKSVTPERSNLNSALHQGHQDLSQFIEELHECSIKLSQVLCESKRTTYSAEPLQLLQKKLRIRFSGEDGPPSSPTQLGQHSGVVTRQEFDGFMSLMMSEFLHNKEQSNRQEAADESAPDVGEACNVSSPSVPETRHDKDLTARTHEPSLSSHDHDQTIL